MAENESAAALEGGAEPLGEVQTDWADSYSNNFREALSNDNVTDIEGLERGYMNLRTKMGSAVFIPSEDAGQETWDKFYAKFEGVDGLMRYDPNNPGSAHQALGRPADVNGYTWEPPEGYEPDPSAAQAIMQLAFEKGLSNEQLQAVRDHLAQNDIKAHVDNENSVSADIGTLREDWGLAFDQNIKTSQDAVQFFDKALKADGKLVEALQDSGLGDNPIMIKMFQLLGRNLNKEPKLRGKVEGGKVDPETASQRIEDIYNNPDHAYHKGTPEAVKLMKQLQDAKMGINNRVVVEDLRITP